MPPEPPARTTDPFAPLRRFTPARIGLGQTGDAPPGKAVLEFQLAHARARDAVHAAVDFPSLAARVAPWPSLRVRSEAANRATYLRRPDLGRRLHPEAARLLCPAAWDMAFVVADGLSARAVDAQALAVLSATRQRLPPALRVAPLVLAEQARVALGDEVGERLGARLVAVLIGERPGLSVADSLGIYVTYAPRQGRRDSERNCISNIHGNGGLTPEEAAATLCALITAALARQLTGVDLKLDEPPAALPGRTG